MDILGIVTDFKNQHQITHHNILAYLIPGIKTASLEK